MISIIKYYYLRLIIAGNGSKLLIYHILCLTQSLSTCFLFILFKVWALIWLVQYAQLWSMSKIGWFKCYPGSFNLKWQKSQINFLFVNYLEHYFGFCFLPDNIGLWDPFILCNAVHFIKIMLYCSFARNS